MQKRKFIEKVTDNIEYKKKVIEVINIAKEVAKGWNGKVITDDFSEEISKHTEEFDGWVRYYINDPYIGDNRVLVMVTHKTNGLCTTSIQPHSKFSKHSTRNFIDLETGVFCYADFYKACQITLNQLNDELADLQLAIDKLDTYIGEFSLIKRQLDNFVNELPRCLKILNTSFDDVKFNLG